eukprot:TRINITY_DN926_c0_g1_i1.p1 TRINITY_DN926_c0_g1~~TRINITY_DN926_c0_g1_i1.p1  ORF type:complete len:540 (+),score=215.52 TRINITY_DN926_c0_g1_i1:32-1621(+)
MSEQKLAKWELVQKRAFTHWVNSQLSKRDIKIETLEDGLQSGVHLIDLIEILTNKHVTMKFSKRPKLRVHKINNCFIALKFLSEDCGLKGLTISAENIVNGHPLNQLLGFCWMLLRAYQGVVSEDNKGQSFEKALLAWLKEKLGDYSDINLDAGFKSESFANGKVVLGLLNEFDSEFINYKDYGVEDALGNCEVGLTTGEEKANVPAIVDADELASGKVSEKNLVLYLSLWFNAFKEKDAGLSKDMLIKRIKQLEEQVRVLTAENLALKGDKGNLEVTVTELTAKLSELQSKHDALLVSYEETSKELASLKETYLTEKSELQSRLSELEENISTLKGDSDESVTLLQNQKDEITKERDNLREELRKTREELQREKEELEAQNADLLANLNKSKKMREELEELLKQQQENHSKSIHALRKHLLQHVHDMHVWKVFLEQDREYESEDLHIVMEAELEDMDFGEQVDTLDTAITEENERLEKLLKEREVEAAEVVSVNIGKKKHRIKKGLEAEHEKQKKESEKPKKKKKSEK